VKFEIRGLGDLQRELEGLRDFFAEMDGRLGAIRLRDSTPEGVADAIAQMHRLVEERTARFARDPAIAGLVEQLKAGLADRIRAFASGSERDRPGEVEEPNQ
jgi:hypothetical protein